MTIDATLERRLVSECLGTALLLAAVVGSGIMGERPSAVAFAVGAYITAAYWFTASTSFANPAVTLGRAVTDRFAGIRPADVPAYLVAQIFGAAADTAVFHWLAPSLVQEVPRAPRAKYV